MARSNPTTAESAIIEPLLPPERGRRARPALDNRRFLYGMLHVLRVGYPWRDMHGRYGKWGAVSVRFRRWPEQDMWDALPDTLVELGSTDNWQHMIDNTGVRSGLLMKGILPLIPSRANRKALIACAFPRLPKPEPHRAYVQQAETVTAHRHPPKQDRAVLFQRPELGNRTHLVVVVRQQALTP